MLGAASDTASVPPGWEPLRVGASRYADLDRPALVAGSLHRGLVADGGLWREVRVLDECTSTNAVVAAEARAGAAEGLVVVAESQTGGRGRLDRTWVSPPRSGLTFSVLLRPPVPPARLGWVPLLAGVALARSVARLCEVDTRLKWPNDLLLGPEGAKAAGVLAEVAGGGVVVGIGLNVTSRRDELPSATATPPTSLALHGAAGTDRDPILRAVLRQLATTYAEWTGSGGNPEPSLRPAYLSLCDTLGRTVTVDLPDGRAVVGRAADVDEDGRLVLETADGPTVLGAGDVVHLRPASGAVTER